MRAALAILAPFLLVSCGSVEERTFRVKALDTEEREVPCVVTRDDQVLLSGANEPIRTPADIKLAFKRAGGEFEAIQLGVKAVQVAPDGKILKGLREGEDSPYTGESRYILPGDAKNQVFFLRKNKNFTSN
jgi:hypothetical protein